MWPGLQGAVRRDRACPPRSRSQAIVVRLQSVRLLTGGLKVRVLPGEPDIIGPGSFGAIVLKSPGRACGWIVR